MAYGIAGANAKAREIFEKGVGEDPDYPLYLHASMQARKSWRTRGSIDIEIGLYARSLHLAEDLERPG